MTCKDCIHCNICNKTESDIYLGNKEGAVELYCVEFADESQYIKLPCKVGDTVYTNIAISGSYLRMKDRPYACKVVFIGLNDSEKYGGGFINIEYSNGYMWQFKFSDIGKTVFLTKKAAEKALREVESCGK